ncbi:MAG: transposase [bacterium]
MRYAVDPRQKKLFDTDEMMFSPMAVKYMRRDWPGLFRTQILHLMPVGRIAARFHPTLGCPTKELYSMAGLIFLKEFFNLTIEEAVRRYITDVSWHFALNVATTEASMSHATIERYMKYFVEDEIAAEVFHRVTSALIEALELDVSRQRLDSTHVFSDMATFGRSKLMGVAIKRFLTQLKRHHRDSYDELDDELRGRYAPSQAKMFADFTGERKQLRQTVAEDLLFMVNHFAEDGAVANRASYKAMARVLQEQCEVSEEKVEVKDETDGESNDKPDGESQTKTVVEVKTKTGGNVMQNPSDPDATYDGHKGPGYQVQISETCVESNDVQLITGVEVEAAHKSDQDALDPMLDQLDEHGRVPEIMYADGGYGRDENELSTGKRGVDLQSPVGGTTPQNKDDLTVDDFVIDEQSETVVRCPNGCQPQSSVHDADAGRTTTVMRSADCAGCEFGSQCPVKRSGGRFVLHHTPAQRRLAARRAEQATDAFKENYAIRAGGESVNSGLKRKTGMGRVRTRGRPRVSMAILFRCAGWNVMRALAALKKCGIRDFSVTAGALNRIAFGFCRRQTADKPLGVRQQPILSLFSSDLVLAAA